MSHQRAQRDSEAPKKKSSGVPKSAPSTPSHGVRKPPSSQPGNRLPRTAGGNKQIAKTLGKAKKGARSPAKPGTASSGSAARGRQPLPADFVPPEGQHLKHGVQRVVIDGDGDHTKELELTLQVVDSWDDTGNYASAKTLAVAVKQISSRATRTVTLDVPKRGTLDLGEPTIQTAPSDGRSPTRIALFGTFREHVLELSPAVHLPRGTVYQATFGGQTHELRFPRERTPMQKLGQAGESSRHADIHFLDITLGPKADRFRLSFRQSGETTTMGVHVLGDDKPAGGRGVALTMLKGEPQPKIVSSDPRTLAIDVDGDGKPDVFIYDSITTAPTRTLQGLSERAVHNARDTRHHHLRLVGPALANDETMRFRVNSRFAEQIDGGQSETDKGAIRDYGDAGIFRAQSVAGGAATATIAIDTAELAMLDQAARNGLVPNELVDLVTELRVTLGEIRRVADRATLFARALKLADSYETAYRKATHQLGSTFPRYRHHQIMTPGRALDRAVGPLKRALSQSDWLAANKAFTRVLAEMQELVADSTIYQGKSNGVAEDRKLRHQSEARRATRDGLLDVPQDPTTMGTLARGKIPVRIPIAFHPDEKYKDEEGYRRAVPFDMYVWNDGKTWWLKNVTNPSRINHFRADASPGETKPPRALFEELNDKDRFPVGVFRYQWPGEKRTEEIAVSGKKTFRDWALDLTMLGLGLLVPAIALAKAGVTVLRVTTYTVNELVSAIGLANLSWDIYDRSRKGDLDAATMTFRAATIVSSAFHYAAAPGILRLWRAESAAAKGAPVTGAAAQKLHAQNMVWIPMLKDGERYADYTTIALMAPLYWERVAEIKQDPSLSPEEKEAAAAGLFDILAKMGLLIVAVWGKGDKAPFNSNVNLVQKPDGTFALSTKPPTGPAPGGPPPDGPGPGAPPAGGGGPAGPRGSPPSSGHAPPHASPVPKRTQTTGPHSPTATAAPKG